MVLIAPDTFVNSWINVKRGYLHGSGSLEQFVIVFRDDHSIAVSGSEKIQKTLQIWRNNSDAPLQQETLQIRENNSDAPPQVEGGDIPEDIAYWLNVAAFRSGKKARKQS